MPQSPTANVSPGPSGRSQGLYRFLRPKAELELEGSVVGGGGLKLSDLSPDLDASIELPANSFALLAVLMRAGIHAERRGGPDSRAFISGQAIRREASRLLGPLPLNYVTKSAYNLRQEIRRVVAPHVGPAAANEYAKALIENHRRFGYRVSCPGGRLHLELLDDGLDDWV